MMRCKIDTITDVLLSLFTKNYVCKAFGRYFCLKYELCSNQNETFYICCSIKDTSSDTNNGVTTMVSANFIILNIAWIRKRTFLDTRQLTSGRAGHHGDHVPRLVEKELSPDIASIKAPSQESRQMGVSRVPAGLVVLRHQFVTNYHVPVRTVRNVLVYFSMFQCFRIVKSLSLSFSLQK